MKKKNKKKRIISIILILAVIVSIVIIVNKNKSKVAEEPDYVTLKRSDVVNSVTANGTVESTNVNFVYSKLNYAVDSVYVEVGSTVKKGELLATLDSKTIKDKIESTQASLSSSTETSEAQLASATSNYEQYKKNLESGLNSSINSAKTAVDNASAAYINSVNSYENLKEGIDLGDNSTILQQQSALNNAKTAMKNAEVSVDQTEDAYKTAKTNLRKAEIDGMTEIQLIQYESARNQAENAYDNAERALDTAIENYNIAKKTYDAAVRGINNQLDDAALAVENAYTSYKNSQKSYDTAENAAYDQLITLENTLNQTKASANTYSANATLRQSRTELNSTRITAPIDGTVTAVYAKEGGSGSGLLFVVEDTDNLLITTSVKEYDIGNVGVGTLVTIKSTTFADQIFNGAVSFIAPTVQKLANGEVATDGDAKFDAEVEITGLTPLKIGMSVKLNFVLNKETNVFAVPFSAVQNGKISILNEDGTTYELDVTTGMESDMEIVIYSDELQEGMKIITNEG